MNRQVNIRPEQHPVRILIAAMGGEGGGLLADWIIAAAEVSGLIVQATSIPGVAQRTGATTYYVEFAPAPAPGESEAVLGLYPVPGDVDLVIASELVEAGRAIENGLVTPDRTSLIAASHRVHAIIEKTAPGDGSIDTAPILAAARAMALRSRIEDFAGLAQTEGVALNALLLGAMAADPLCPIEAEVFHQVIRERGVAVESNLKGFTLGFESGCEPDAVSSEPQLPRCERPALTERIEAGFPQSVRDMVAAGAQRTADYQDDAYAGVYLDRLAVILETDKAASGARHKYDLTRTTARLLALWMAYEDVIAVAKLKTDPARARRIREETGAGDGELVQVREVLKPGLDEMASVLPAPLARVVIAAARKFGLEHKLNMAMHLRSDTIWGYLRLRMLARLTGLRRRGLRFSEEQKLIETWLGQIAEAAGHDRRLALEVAALAELVKGYSDTRRRGFERMQAISEQIIIPALDGSVSPGQAAKAVREARRAILDSPDDDAAERVLSLMVAGNGKSAKAETTVAAE